MGSGNANIAIAIFVVLWLATSGLSYHSYQEAEKSREKLKKEENKLERSQQKLKNLKIDLSKLSNLVGYRKKLKEDKYFESSPGAIANSIYKVSSNTDLGVDYDEKIDTKQLFVVEYLHKIPDLQIVWDKMTKKIEDLQTETKNLRREIQSGKTSFNDEFSGTQKDIAQLQEEIEGIKNSIQNEQIEFGEKLRLAEKNRASEQEKKLVEKDKLAKLLQEQKGVERQNKEDLESLDERIKELKVAATGDSAVDELIAEEKTPQLQDSPDGEIVYVNNESQTAYIDLGRSKGILPGLSFKVFRYGKGGVKKFKGKVTVKKVEPNMSLVGINETTSVVEPIIPGDMIINPVFDRDKVKYFVIAGDLEKYTQDQISRRVAKLGGRVEKDISAKTDFVILATGFKNDDSYTTAIDRGIETMLETEFYAYIGD